MAIDSIETGYRQVVRTRAVVALDDPVASDTDTAGAKAAALARAAAAGLPVLAGMVVTTSAFAGDRGQGDIEADLRTTWSIVSDSGHRPIVVRSSSTIEDNSSSSMAGMFTSVLDVTTYDGFRMALDAVVASSTVVALTGPEARTRVRAPMAVLVQPQLAAAVGGVLFGLDPVSGRRDRLVVSASSAGPSAVVSGEVDGTRYLLSHRGRRLEGPAAGELSPIQLRQLAGLARQAEAVFGGPQDIEWAFGPDGRLWLLQSRPITAAASTERGNGPVLGPGPVAETFPDVLSALEEDLWVAPLRDGLRAALTLAGTAPKRRLATSPVVTTAGGRVAADLELLGATDGPTSFARRLDPRPPARRLVAAWRVGRLRAALPALADDLLATADSDLLDVPSPTTLSDRELLSLLGRAGPALSALHGHEVLMGWLVASSATSTTAASIALRALAASRADGMSDAEILSAYPGVLALVPPRIGSPIVLPPTPETLGLGAANDAGVRARSGGSAAGGAPAAGPLGPGAHGQGGRGTRPSPGGQGGPGRRRPGPPPAPGRADRGGPWRTPTGRHRHRRPRPGRRRRPLPTRFRLTEQATVVPVAGRTRRRGRIGGSHGAGAGAGAGTGAGGGRGMGPVHAGDGPPEPGSVLVVRTLDPNLAAVLPRLGGLVAETGSFLSHLAILARELNIPTVVGVEDALHRFPVGTVVVVDGTTGEVSRVSQPVKDERGVA